MLCEICHKKPAKVHVTRIENNKQFSLHLCQDCARSKHVTPTSLDPSVSVAEWLAAMRQGAYVRNSRVYLTRYGKTLTYIKN